MEITDIRNSVIAPGDTIAGAFRTGNKAELRIGVVTGFGERGNELTVEVKWSITSGTDGDVRGIAIYGGIEAGLHRFIKIVD